MVRDLPVDAGRDDHLHPAARDHFLHERDVPPVARRQVHERLHAARHRRPLALRGGLLDLGLPVEDREVLLHARGLDDDVLVHEREAEFGGIDAVRRRS